MENENSSTSTESTTRHVCLPFSPKPHQTQLAAALNEIPRYLFRVHAPSTAGQTTAEEVVSRAASLGRASATTDILAMPARVAAEMLNCHMRGWSRDSDNLMSWSSSLLFVLQYALYRSIKQAPDEMSDIHVYVLDTTGLPHGAFIPDIPLLDTFADKDVWKTHNLAKIGRLRRETPYNFGEYLCQGTLSIEGRATSASLQDIVNLGLFRLCAEMGGPNENKELAKRVCRLRTECFESPKPTTKAEVRTATTLAQGCFGEEWVLPMMAAFLSLRKRPRNDGVIGNAFKANFSERELQEYDLGAVKTFLHDRLPEVHQFAKVIQDIHNDHCTQVIDSVVATTMKLSLNPQPPQKKHAKADFVEVDEDERW